MPLIENIRINGQTTIVAPTIAGLHPVIGWDYDEDIAAWAQAFYSIRIGTSAIDLGTNEFIGDLLNIDMVSSSSNFFEHTLHNLQRGVTYFGEVKAFDPEGDDTPWSTFSFTTNNLPFVTGFSLSPVSPEVADDIEISYTYHDVDGHEQAGTKIRWFKNNLPISEFDDLCILPSKATTADDSWSAKIIPSDGLEFGAIVETSSVTIIAAQSTFENVVIFPADGNVDDIFKVEWSLTETEYTALVGTVTFEWLINNVSVANSNNQFMRLDVIPGDVVSAILTLTQSDGTVLSEASSALKTVLDVDWHVFNFTINELSEEINITDLSPILEWNISKSTAGPDDVPAFFKILVTKTPSISGPIFDSGETQYTKNSFVIPDGILSRGQNYFVHIGVSDISPIPSENFIRKEINILGSSWNELVSNSTGWTIETKLFIEGNSLLDGQTGLPLPNPIDGETNPLPRMGVYIHDGTRFCTVMFELDKVVFHSDTTLSVDFPIGETDLQSSKTFRIAGQNNDIKIFANNKLLLDATGAFTNSSKLKFIEYGDIDGKYSSTGVFRFFRYSTTGAFGIGTDLPDENTYYFFDVGQIEGGEIQYVKNNIISWLPNDTSESAKLLDFNENSDELQLPTTAKNFSPITTIALDQNRNKYIGTANGANAIYGEKHDPDYEFLTSSTDVVITTEDFDRITTVDANSVSVVEPDSKPGWFTIDTTFRTIGIVDLNEGFDTGDPYDPYKFGIDSHAIHYYSQRTHGHSWYDMVDNEKGWQLTFSFQLEHLEQDDFQEQDIDHQGFGVYINDGVYQEILFFYQDRIRLFYANVFVPIVTSSARNYRIVGKGKDLLIYQKLDIPSITSYQLIVNGSGMFTTPATVSGNSRRPKMIFDSNGLYHAVWHDDGNSRSQLFYSVYDGSSWSNPEIVANSKFNLRNPSISIDSTNRIWIAYEDTSWGQTEISVSARDDNGWNLPTRITNARSNKANPDISVDAFDNVHVVWEDDKNGPSQILWAQRDKSKEAWISSGQFGEDTIILQQRDFNDPYMEGAVHFKNPELAYDHPRLWVVCEALKESDHKSSIYRSSRNVETEIWQSMGVPIFNSAGEFVGDSSSTLVSSPDRNCVNPTIAASSTKGLIIAWEDQTEPISQIWGASYNTLGTEVVEATQVTSRLSDCKHPTVGWVSNQAPILFEFNDDIRLSNYDGNFKVFKGSATGGTDELIQITGDRKARRPSVANSVPAQGFRFVYEFLRESNTSLDSMEFPDYYLIGDASVAHAELSSPTNVISTSTLSDEIVSSLDTKEFAFGDMSENVSLRAHWKDIQLYFGYDAKPHSIAKFNNATVLGWGDDRVNDIFIDTFGNLIVAKYDGLFYHNVFTGELTNIEGHTLEYVAPDPLSNDPTGCIGDDDDGTCLFRNKDGTSKVITTVKWGGNGAWYVGTTEGLYLSTSAGKIWSKFTALTANTAIHAIDIDSAGNAICATSRGVVIAPPDASEEVGVQLIPIRSNLPLISGITDNIRAIGIDENNVIWAGGDRGLVRIENKTNFLFFNKKNGMRASYVTDIAIVNKHLRFVSTLNGVDKMHGTTFSSISTQTHELLNNNISRIAWEDSTQSLWAASLYTLHEIIFRDPDYDIIKDEIVQYDAQELLTDESFESDTYTVLDIDELQQGDEGELKISPESAFALINKNKLDFGFAVGELGKSISFSTPLLPGDEVEVLISNRFIKSHDFNQTDIEKQVIGEKRTSIKKIITTSSTNKTLMLSGEDKHQILLAASDDILPFTTVLLDRDLPTGCLEQTSILTSTTLKFKIFAIDNDSGIDGYMLSNFENFTSDGETPLDFASLPLSGVVTHNIGTDLNNVTTSLTFPASATLPDLSTTTIGIGSAVGRWTDIATNTTYLMAGTSNPAVIWKFNPETETWSAIAQLDASLSRSITEMKEFNNILYVATQGLTGVVYKTANGTDFTAVVTSVNSTRFTSIATGLDGVVYFGDGAGSIYSYKDGAIEETFTSIGNSVESIDIWNNFLIVGTSNQGRIYLIDTETEDNIVIFTGDESTISNIHIKDASFSPTAEQTSIYASSGDFTTIYRANLESFDFIKSFNSVNRDINKITSIDRDILESDPPASGASITQAVSSMGDSLFKHNEPDWEFFHRHDEEIQDFMQYAPGTALEGIYLISENKIDKWTNQLKDKTVYLRLRDKAGNVSAAPNTDNVCPDPNLSDEDRALAQCCTFAYSLKISDLKNFINESRIVDVTEYGDIIFTFDSPTKHQFYSADEIDEEIGIYTSEVLNGSNELVSWKTITWISVEPTGTFVDVQVRSGATKSDTELAEWSADIVKGVDDLVSLEHITDQYLQFRVILKSQSRDLSPTLTSVTIRNLTTQASHFFTTNFIMPSRVIKGLLTTNTFIPVSADIVFGINTKNSIDFGDYQIIEPNRLFTSSQGQFGEDFRIGVKMLSPGIPQLSSTNAPGDPYDSSTFVCSATFAYENTGITSNNFHFRAQFYNDPFRTQLIHTFFSGNDQTGWSHGAGESTFPATGLTIASSASRSIQFEPLDQIESNQRWYITISAWDGEFFETILDDKSYICSACNITNEINLVSEYYKTGLPATLTTIPRFSSFTPDFTLLENNISFAEVFGEWTTTKGQVLSGYTDQFAARLNGKIQAPTAGSYAFELQSSDGSILFIDAEEVINHDGTHGFTTATGSVFLTEGFHDIDLHYFEGTGGAALELRWITPGESTAVVVPPQRLFHAVASEYCDDSDSPILYNFGILFELENGETVKINLDT